MKNIKNILLPTAVFGAVFIVFVSLLSFATKVTADENLQNKDEGDARIVREKDNERNGGERASSTNKKIEENDDEFDVGEHLDKIKNIEHELSDIAKEQDDENEQEINDIANEQDESASTSARAILEIEQRNKIQEFLFGSDYKNLGVLRSEIAKTKNRIDKLDKLAENLQNATSTEEIKSQVQNLLDEQAKIENFVKDQENNFSLFGWLFKMFQ